MRKIILGLIIALSGVMLMSQNTFADWVQQSNVNINSRTYKICQGNSCTTTTENNFGTKTIPFNLLGYTNGYNKYLLEIVADKAINDTSSDRFKSVMVDITIKQTKQSSQSTTIMHIYPEEMGFTLTTNKGDKYGGCIMNERGDDYVQYRCGADAPENSTLQHWYMRIGDKSLNGENFAYIGSISSAYLAPTNNINPIVLTYSSVNITNTSDPAVSLLQQQINQNQTIINQNQQIINAQNETNNWLKDTTPPNVDTSSLGSSVGWMPAGPVDSILTLPLQLLQGIINVFTNTNCSPLQVPVPYVNEDITLPCVSTLMDDIGFTPVWNIVGGVISAVIIWDTLKWLYRFVDDTLTFRENNSGMWGGL